MPFDINQWANIAGNYRDTILLGNGASIAVSPRFSYESLLQHALARDWITNDVKQLFEFFRTNDFELVLRLVWQASNVNRSLQIPDERTYQAYIRVRECLIQSVRDIHPEHNEIALALPSLYGYLKNFDTVISLNYDLIVYWIMTYGFSVEDQHSFKDCFLNGVFDGDWQRFRQPIGRDRTTTLVFYPHGSLIFCRDIVEAEYKIHGNGNALLESILRLWQNETALPLFVSEGIQQQKINSICNSYYLSTVYREVLNSPKTALVIYGWGFGEHDLHLLQRMANSGIQRVAISVFRNDQSYCNKADAIVRQYLGQFVRIEFFDSQSTGF